MESWSLIEAEAVKLYQNKISSNFQGNLDMTARNLCLLHITALVSSQEGSVYVEHIHREFIYLVEAGLLRIRTDGKYSHQTDF